MNASQIKEHMSIVCSEDKELGKVDHLDGGNTIKIAKDDKGQHHWIPVSWVAKVDDKVHLDRSGDEVMKQWMTSPPVGVTS
jgi:hypothetical protein